MCLCSCTVIIELLRYSVIENKVLVGLEYFESQAANGRYSILCSFLKPGFPASGTEGCDWIRDETLQRHIWRYKSNYRGGPGRAAWDLGEGGIEERELSIRDRLPGTGYQRRRRGEGGNAEKGGSEALCLRSELPLYQRVEREHKRQWKHERHHYQRFARVMLSSLKQ